ncbi:MAG: hypothetical protein HFJ52_08825 [Clostridia bacterium]|nr:hypothetical protein [Clostridia bacterium]
MKTKALLVMTGKEIQVVKIPASLKFIRAFIGKNLFKIELTDNTFILANEKAPLEEFNRFYQGRIILGSFIIISTKKGHISSMNKKSIRYYSNIFRLKRHQRKIQKYKDSFLEKYYSKKEEHKNVSTMQAEFSKIAT